VMGKTANLFAVPNMAGKSRDGDPERQDVAAEGVQWLLRAGLTRCSARWSEYRHRVTWHKDEWYWRYRMMYVVLSWTTSCAF